LENLKGRDHLEDIGVDGRILEWLLVKIGWKGVTGFIWLKWRTCEHGNEPSGSIKSREFLD
jgi:hypothetical protein